VLRYSGLNVMVRAGHRAIAPVVLALCVVTSAALGQTYSFYDVAPVDLAGPPGSVIRSEEIRGAPSDARAYRVLYRSTGLAEEPIAVSAIVVVPVGRGDARKVVAWAHPTTGIARRCAPSLRVDALASIPRLDELAARGHVVAATDYPGLGTAGEHPYLVGVSEGRAVLDSVRAARALVGDSAGNEFVIWGYSQGGHAAVWAGEIAAEYAPELAIAGIAAIAPATELATLFEDDLGTPAGQGLTALTLVSWSRVYGHPIETIIDTDALEPVRKIAAECLDTPGHLLVDLPAIRRLTRGFLAADPTKTAPWSGWVSANTPGHKPPGGPFFIAQGDADTVVDPPVTKDFATKLCDQGAAVSFFDVPGGTHELINNASAERAVAWIDDRFAGKTAPSDCVAK